MRSAAKVLSVLLLLLAALTVSVLTPPIHSQTALPAGPPITLAEALKKTAIPEGIITIAVSAEEIGFPGGAGPEPGASLDRVASSYSMVVRQFGAVRAVAPGLMTLLNPNPTVPDPYQDLPPGDAFQLLTTSLSAPQWQQITSPGGLGFTDLDELQRPLFKSLFPGGTLSIKPDPTETRLDCVNGAPTTPPQQVGPEDLLRSRLRLSQTVQVELPIVGQAHRFLDSGSPTKPGAATFYSPDQWEPGAHRLAAGVVLKGNFTNTPKAGELDYKAPRFRAPVRLDGIKTVGNLITRIGWLTGTELYADPRYENRSLSILGLGATATAADLLPAVAFCLTGTYRRVGTAFVLTHDVTGIGARRELLARFLDTAQSSRQSLMAHAISPGAAHPVSLLPLRSDSVAITPDQDRIGASRTAGPGLENTIDLPYAQLTQEQQEAVQTAYRAFQAQETREASEPFFLQHPENIMRVTPDGTIRLKRLASLQLAAPGLDGPVDISAPLRVSNAFSPPAVTWSTVPDASMRHSSQSPLLSPLLSPLAAFDRISNRACLVRPRSLAELDGIIAAMPAADLNELWLVVYPSGGVAAAQITGPPTAPALIQRALERTRGTNIRVFPTLSVMLWTQEAPSDLLDLNITGETLSQAESRETSTYRRRRALQGFSEPARAPGADDRAAVSPFSPVVASTLSQLIDAVTLPGIAGFCWRSTVTDGYEIRQPEYNQDSRDELGYTTSARLEFLRLSHADPVDIGPSTYGAAGYQADMSLPLFDNAQIEQMLRTGWGKLREATDLSLLQRLCQVFRSAAASRSTHQLGPVESPKESLPLILEAQGTDRWYGEWSDPLRPRPYNPIQDYRTTPAPESAAAGAQSRLRYTRRGVWTIKDSSDLASVFILDSDAGWQGILFDLRPTDNAIFHTAIASLTHLAQLLRPGPTEAADVATAPK